MREPSLPDRRRDRLRRLVVDIEPLRRDRDFRLLWIGQVVSGLGRQVTAIVLPYQLYVLTGTPLAIGALALVQVVPIMAFSLGGGVVADAVDRRRAAPPHPGRPGGDERRPGGPRAAAGDAGPGDLRGRVRGRGLRGDRPARPRVRDSAPRPARAPPCRHRPEPAELPGRCRGRTGGRRRGSRHVRDRGGLRVRRGHVRGRDLGARLHRADPAGPRRPPPEPVRDRGRPALRPTASGHPRHVRGGPQRDGLRHADRALPRPCPGRVPRRPGWARDPCRGAGRRGPGWRAADRLGGALPADRARRAVGLPRLGARDHRVRAVHVQLPARALLPGGRRGGRRDDGSPAQRDRAADHARRAPRPDHLHPRPGRDGRAPAGRHGGKRGGRRRGRPALRGERRAALPGRPGRHRPVVPGARRLRHARVHRDRGRRARRRVRVRRRPPEPPAAALARLARAASIVGACPAAGSRIAVPRPCFVGRWSWSCPCWSSG